MAAPWSGFSQIEIEKIKLESNFNPATTNVQNGTHQKVVDSSVNKETTFKQKKNSPISKRMPTSPTTTKGKNSDLPNEALFSAKSTQQENGHESPMHVKLKILEDTTSFEIMETAHLITNTVHEEQLSNEKTEGNHPVSDSLCQSPLLTLSVDLLQNGGKKDPVNLDEFEKKQKLIEEQNRLKKQMLAKALAMRKMKTQAEAQKLQQIQEELSKLDAHLSNDVCILRSHIEVASVELSEAEKRYIKAEREFVEAKQLLFNKRERKDLLTEHLCAIIEQNELRKAHRLTDLMVQLDDEINETHPPHDMILQTVPVTASINDL